MAHMDTQAMSNLSAARIVYKLGMRYGIKFLLGRVHVGTPASEVAADMRRRVAGAFQGKAAAQLGADAKALGEAVCAEACVLYALMAHKHNGRTYRRVMAGR